MSAPVLSWLFHAVRKSHTCRNKYHCSHKFQKIYKVESITAVKLSQFPPIHPSFIHKTLTPNPQSQSLSRGYGSILPTSLIYIVLSTRGCTPWRPEAVMSTTRGANKSLHWVFKGRRKCTGQYKRNTAFPETTPYRRAIRFQGLANCEKEKRTLPRTLASVPNFGCVTTHYPRSGSGILT